MNGTNLGPGTRQHVYNLYATLGNPSATWPEVRNLPSHGIAKCAPCACSTLDWFYTCEVVEKHTLVKCTVHAGSGTNYTVQVCASGQCSAQSSTVLSFEQPAVDSMAPDVDHCGGGSHLTIKGKGIFPVNTNVTIGENFCTGLTYSREATGRWSLSCYSPSAGEPCSTSALMNVTTFGRASAAVDYGYYEVTGSSALQRRVPSRGGSVVTLAGRGFKAATGISALVYVRRTQCSQTNERNTLACLESKSEPIQSSTDALVAEAALTIVSATSVSFVMPGSLRLKRWH